MLDQKIDTSFHDEGHYRPTWPLFGLSSFQRVLEIGF